jgi:DNA-binding NtrC family response regulator
MEHIKNKVLIIEDIGIVAKGLKEFLEANRYKVETASILAEAREKINHKRYNLIISDMGKKRSDIMDINYANLLIPVIIIGVEPDVSLKEKIGIVYTQTPPITRENCQFIIEYKISAVDEALQCLKMEVLAR